MNLLLKTAFRNIFRNTRRSLMTISAIAVGAMSMLLFGEFVNYIVLGLQTNAVKQGGHVALFRNGYFKYGSGNPSAYGIPDYSSVISLLSQDPLLKSRIAVITPTINLFGIAGNFDADVSKTFFGVGLVPLDYRQMQKWDEYDMGRGYPRSETGLVDDDITRGFVGAGVGRILGLCKPLHLTDCPSKQPPIISGSPSLNRDFSSLTGRDKDLTSRDQNSTLPRLDLLAGTTAGAPNVVSLYVDRAVPLGVKELDDSFIGMHFNLAQQLLFGRSEHQAISIVLQFHNTEEMSPARARIEQLIREKRLDLEVRDLLELQPFYKQVVSMFGSIFSFIAAIMGVIVLFMVINTMSMSVMERTQEIGTLRALGVKRKGIRLQFLIEGLIIGVLGATAGILLGSAAAEIINHAGLTWLPPGQAAPVPLNVLTNRSGGLMFGIWLGLCLMAALASFIPANRAARMKVVDALGHV
ncbi:MAG: ABC transporter permease [Nitrospirae bacterium]|nr:ABC transporter permease [Nitrospirota bacterium]